MRVVPLGGADEVGASCTLVELAGRRVLVDAGIRMHNNAGTGVPRDPLPDLVRIRELGGVHAILVTHAHADHIGALPLLHRAFPAVPIFATPATLDLMRVMLADAVKLMRQKADLEADYPLYDADLVAGMLDKVVPVVGPFNIGEDIKVHPWRAGHILGAVMYGITSPEGSVCVTGDVLISPQRTLPGAVVPRFHPDLLLMESTYGNRLHANRHEEERRLAQAVAEVIARGGHVLIPAFALGRAQEVVLILRAHQEAGLIPTFPIWVDGMVKSICDVYARYPEELSSPLRHAMRSGNHPFYSDKSTIRPVADTATRERILAGAPACIVASSGMLTGGASQFYAMRLAGTPQHAIFLCGYQDEESPGRRLLESVQAQAPMLSIAGQEINVRCRVDRYGLSAHADMNALAAMAAQLRPHHVVLLHGEEGARQELANILRRHAGVFLPVNCEELQFTYRKAEAVSPASANRRTTGLGKGQPFTAESALLLWQSLRASRLTRPLTADELAARWYGHAIPAGAAETVTPILAASPYFHSDDRQPWLFYLCRPDEVEAAKRRLNLVAEAQALPGSLLLVRTSMGDLRAAVCLSVEGAAIRLAAVGMPVGLWPVESVIQWIGPWNGRPDESEVQRELLGVLDSCRKLVLQLPWSDLVNALPATATAYTLDDVVDLWKEQAANAQNGATLGNSAQEPAYRLAVALVLNSLPELVERQAQGLLAVTYSLRHNGGAQITSPSVSGATVDASALSPLAGRLEQNAALAVVDKLLNPDSGLYRKGLSLTDHQIVLYFKFPSVAQQRLAETLRTIAAVTGWSIAVHPETHMGALCEQAEVCLGPGCQLQRAPSVYREKHEVVVQCSVDALSDAQLADAAQRFYATTGWRLVVNGKRLMVEDETDQKQISPPAVDVENQYRPDEQAEPLEINKAYQVIKAVFANDEPARLYKAGKKTDPHTGSHYIELSFITPEIGARYADLLTACARDIGWELRINPEPNQIEISACIRRLLPPGWQLLREPSLFRQQHLARLRLAQPPEDQSAWTSFCEQVKAATGYDVALA